MRKLSIFDMHAPWSLAMWLAAHENVKAMLLTNQQTSISLLALIHLILFVH
jgi:hypothetical protein